MKIYSANTFNDQKAAILIPISTLYTSRKSNVPFYYHKRYQTEFWVQFLATRMPDFHTHAEESDGGVSCFSCAASLKKMGALFNQLI